MIAGGEKKGHPAKKTKPEGEEIPLIVQDTVQRLDSYPKGIKALFNAVCLLPGWPLGSGSGAKFLSAITNRRRSVGHDWC